MNQDKELFFKILQKSEYVAVIGHLNPDGDSVGSATAMGRHLASIGKKFSIIFPSEPSEMLTSLYFGDSIHSFSEDSGECAKASEAIAAADLILCIDLNTIDRTDAAAPLIRASAAKKVLIDHHPSPESDAFDIVFSDTGMSSACEYLFWILMDAPTISGDILKMDFDCAKSLCAGMLTDTNNFSNSLSPSTFRMASMLLECGIDVEETGRYFFGNYSEDRLRLLGHLLDDMYIDRELKCACIVLSRKTQMKFHFRTGDSEGFVNYGLKLAGIEVSAFFTEEKDRIRVSLRSRGNVSVNRLSRRFFNGGGHEKASGGRLNIPVTEVKKYFINSLTQFLKEENPL